MRTLYVKLTLLFLAVSLAGTLLAVVLIRRQNAQVFERFLREQGLAEFVRDAQAYYTYAGTLEGVESAILPRTRPGDRRPPLPFALADGEGYIIVGAGPWRSDQQAPPKALEDGVPVEVDGQQVGTVLLTNQEWERAAFENRFLAGINRALFFGAVGATILALTLGALLARTLTRPLRELAGASRALAQGNLGAQVPVRTQDELGELAAAFNQMSAELDRAVAQRRQMTADIAHDLRTPLTVLAGYLEAMDDGSLAPTPDRLAIMQQEVQGLTRLVEDLRILSLADAGELPLAPEAIDVGRLLERVRQAHEPQAGQQGVRLGTEVAPALPSTHLDPERMRQVLGNLVSNALRHTGAGGSVTLAAGLDGPGTLLVEVRDTGSGIPPEDLPHIFNRFYRGDRARAEGQGESGLGLAIVRSLVTMHRGKITVDSAPGRGTTFSIRLPL